MSRPAPPNDGTPGPGDPGPSGPVTTGPGANGPGAAGQPGRGGERKGFPLRIDPELFEALRRWANDELRSVNAQIEFLLSRAVRDAGRAGRRRPDEEERPR